MTDTIDQEATDRLQDRLHLRELVEQLARCEERERSAGWATGLATRTRALEASQAASRELREACERYGYDTQHAHNVARDLAAYHLGRGSRMPDLTIRRKGEYLA